MRSSLAALKYLEIRLQIKEKSLSINHPSLCSIYHNIACILDEFCRYEQSLQHTEKAIDVAKLTFNSNQPSMEMLQENLSNIQRKLRLIGIESVVISNVVMILILKRLTSYIR
jgi:hypothetical protein